MTTTKKVSKVELRFSIHIPANSERDDYHYLKEVVTYDDGTQEPRIRLVKDYERPVWATIKPYRNHRDKKEFEEEERLSCQMTTQSNLNRVAAGMINKPYAASKNKLIKEDPYIYGYDVSSTSFLKAEYLERNDFVQSLYNVAVLDIETTEDGTPIMVTVTNKGKAACYVISDFLKNVIAPHAKVKAAIAEYLPKYKDMDYQLHVVSDSVEAIRGAFATLNDWAPDFVAVWNVDFDLSKILNELDKYGIDPIDVIADPDIPRHLRICKYKKGKTKKVTVSGKQIPINPSLQWHHLECTAKFFVIDAMCVYRQIRMAKAEEPSYSLDAILQKELGSRKLKFAQADAYKAGAWHWFMQANYPIEYIVYNLYDCLGVEELDEKTRDLCSSIASFAGITDFKNFNKQSVKLADALYLFGRTKGLVIGTASPPPDNVPEDVDYEQVAEDDEGDDEFDPSKYKTLGLKGWIQLLPQNRLIHNGLKLLEDFPNVRTAFRGITCDFDAKSSYPSCTQAGNVSRGTCVNEIIDIIGLPEHVFREQNLSVCLGAANMLEYFNVMFQMPDLEEIDHILETEYA